MSSNMPVHRIPRNLQSGKSIQYFLNYSIVKGVIIKVVPCINFDPSEPR